MASTKKQVMANLEGLTLDNWRECHSDSEVMLIAKDALDMMKEQQQIVRCNDCKWHKNNGVTSTKWLPCMEIKTQGNWFCADGERE